jgi:putative membrane protein
MSNPARLGAVLVLAPAVLFLSCGQAAAADSIIISNTETVQARLNADGTVREARVYEQIALQGKGTVVVKNPVSTDKLRNLDGFGNFTVKDGSIVSTQKVNGDQRLRSVSDFDKKLPLLVSVSYKLDGKSIKAGDLVGKSGRLDVHYKVENVTGKNTSLTFDDGTGKKVTQTQKVVIPMVGSLTTLLPSSFVDVTSGEANMAGDGQGQTKMSFTMTLFAPVATPISEFGYSATISDGVIPGAAITALPVSPLDSPSFKGAAASYKGGADTGVTLTAGATEIDANVLKLRDGAQTLIAGLIQLRDGAQKLNTGLAGEAAPGANKLADGATKLQAGAGQLAAGAGDAKAGAGQLADGSGQLSAGAKKLDTGAGVLKDGLSQASAKAPDLIDGLDQVYGGLELVDGGLVKMYGGIGELPAKAQPLHDGISKMLAGLGNKTTNGTLIFGVESIRQGLATLAVPGLQKAIDGLYSTSSTAPGAYQKLDCAQRILKDVVNGTLANATAGTPNPCYYDAAHNPKASTPVLRGLTDTADFPAAGMTEMSKSVTAGVQSKLSGSLTDLANASSPTTPSESNLVGGLYKIKAGLDTHAPKTYGADDPGGAGYALSLVECGLSSATLPGMCDTARPGLLEGLGAVDAGVSELVSGVVAQVQGGIGKAADVAPDQNTLRGGTHAVMGGIDLIAEGGLTLLDGLGKLDAGAGQLKAGTGELVKGTAKLAPGASQLYVGLGKLSSGATTLSDGTVQLSDGADKLASGLGDAATGSGQLADGLATAADGGKALPEGAARLSAEGTSKLVEAGKSTASDYGLKYAVIVAGAERAKTEGMAYGAPADAAGATAYSLEISGANADGGTNMGRGAGALALFGSGAGLVLFRRRLV